MYDIIENIIGYIWIIGFSDQQYIFYCCIVLIIIFFCVFIDLIYWVFCYFWYS